MTGAIGVVGAGTMGAGIAATAALGGRRVLLVEVDDAMRASAPERVAAALAQGTRRERWSAEEATAAAARVEPVAGVDAIAGCALAIEAIPEELELKRRVLGAIQAVGPEIVLATNTSSLSVSAIASGLADPTRLVGLHFFNPAALLPVVEVVAGVESDPALVRRVTELAQAWGKHPVLSDDRPGFIVNRCARPIYGEPDRILAEGIADPAHVDEIFRTSGFPKGPFELMDLIGLDVNLAIQTSLWQQAYGEPRWRPGQAQARLVAAGRLGRKSGRGFHAYPAGPAEGRVQPPVPTAFPPGDVVAIHGDGPLADALRSRFAERGLTLAGDDADVHVDAGLGPIASRDGVHVALCWHRSLAGHRLPRAIGFSIAAPLDRRPCVELTAGPLASDGDRERARTVFAAAGLRTTWVGDGPGLVLARVVAQLVNEASFAVQEGLAEPGAIDEALRLGLAHPAGPLEWGRALGLDAVLAILDGLHAECGDDRYRAAPLLRRCVSFGLPSVTALHHASSSQETLS